MTGPVTSKGVVTPAAAATLALKAMARYRTAVVSDGDVAQAVRRFAAAEVRPQHLLETLLALEAPRPLAAQARPPGPAARRAVLGVLLGLAAGLEPEAAARAVDRARGLWADDIIDAVAHFVATGAFGMGAEDCLSSPMDESGKDRLIWEGLVQSFELIDGKEPQ